MMNRATKAKVGARLRRVAGQVEGIARMVEEDRYCVDILLQVASAQAALGQVAKIILRAHAETCVTDAIESDRPVERKQKLDELMGLLVRYGRLGSA